MLQFLDQLNSQQRESVETTEGPLLILAGAGSGKTRVITYRIVYLICQRGVSPGNILAVTFTNKAADQMKERVARLLAAGGWTAGGAPLPVISTFHALGVRILRQEIGRLGYSRDFSIYDESDQLRLVKSVLKELGVSDPTYSPRAVMSRISNAKNRYGEPRGWSHETSGEEDQKTAMVCERYEKQLRQANALDFDDLLLKTIELFGKFPDVRERYNRRFQYIHVDEYQDINRAQYDLIRLLTCSHHNICAVGDEDQCIYGWRGASIENILNFERDYPGTKIVRLEQNYRSTQMILDAAGAVVSRNKLRKGKVLWTQRSYGQRIGLFEAQDAEQESDFVAAQVGQALAGGGDLTVGILYRTNFQSRLFEEALRVRGIAYRVVGGLSFYARAEIKDILAYARFVINRQDSVSLARIINTPARGVGNATVRALEEAARSQRRTLWEVVQEAARGSGGGRQGRPHRALRSFCALIEQLAADSMRLKMSEFFASILRRTGYLDVLQAEHSLESESRSENLKELVNAAAEAEGRGETLSSFLDRAALISDTDDFDEHGRVTLMTLHSAKGLEFSYVFLVGLEEGLLPHKFSTQDEAEIEEERRLCYVGMTRAKDRLTLSYARNRRIFGRETTSGAGPSRFLGEIPAHLLERLGAAVLDNEPKREKSRQTWPNSAHSPESVDRWLRQHGAVLRSQPWTRGEKQTRNEGRWRLGMRVRHPKYGLGTVVECEGSEDEARVTVSFAGYGVKKLIQRYALLEEA